MPHREAFQEASLSEYGAGRQTTPDVLDYGSPLTILSRSAFSEEQKRLTRMTHTAEEIAAWLAERLAALLGLAPEHVDRHEDFTAYGLSSADAALLSGDLEDWLEWRLEPTIAWEYSTIAALSQYLADEQAHQDGETAQSNGDTARSHIRVAPGGATEQSLDELFAEIEQLSDEDVQNALKQTKS